MLERILIFAVALAQSGRNILRYPASSLAQSRIIAEFSSGIGVV